MDFSNMKPRLLAPGWALVALSWQVIWKNPGLLLIFSVAYSIGFLLNNIDSSRFDALGLSIIGVFSLILYTFYAIIWLMRASLPAILYEQTQADLRGGMRDTKSAFGLLMALLGLFFVGVIGVVIGNNRLINIMPLGAIIITACILAVPFLICWLYLLIPIIVLKDKQTLFGAMRRSTYLMKRNWGHWLFAMIMMVEIDAAAFIGLGQINKLFAIPATLQPLLAVVISLLLLTQGIIYSVALYSYASQEEKRQYIQYEKPKNPY